MLIFLITIIFLLNLWAIFDVLSLRRESDVEKKFLWVIVILFLPFLGLILYVLFGSRKIIR
ncbi:MAG: PLDc N-terminal domain-containing protein [Candidatus Omnitrophica bacterium]|nr:PLDc N-terminal domain-containing protein [Candidatus Omnitrophota bacterium]